MSTVNNGPQIVRNGLVLDLDASSVTSYSAIAVYSVQCYSTYNGGLRSANYTVQYSDDNSTWTTAFTGVMSNNSSCGIITGTNRNDSNYSKHRYWRYVEGAAIAGHHPRVARIDFITKSGAVYNLTTYTTDNCSDSGTYIVGTVSKDFGTTTWRDISGNNYNGSLNTGPLFSSANLGSIAFDGTTVGQEVNIGTKTINFASGGTFEIWTKIDNVNRNQGFFSMSPGTSYINFYSPGATNQKMRWEVIGNVGVSYNAINSLTTLQNNVWYHVVGNFDPSGGSTRIYINGSLDNSQSSYTNVPSSVTGQIIIGEYAGILDGNIAVAKIYNRVLSASEIMQNYQATKTRFGL